MTKVLLTGIGGSIGCHTHAHILKNTDWNVIGIDSFRHKGLFDRVNTTVNPHPGWAERTMIFTHDLTAPLSEMLIRQIGEVDYIINMASLSDVRPSITDPAWFIDNNMRLMLTMLEYARAHPPLKAFMQISTDEVYGPTDGKTLHKEWDPIVPSNAYSASKAAQEAMATSYWRSYGLPLIVVNLMNNFGEMQSPDKFPAIVQRKVRAGECVHIHATNGVVGSRFYLHSRNSADAFIFLLKNVTPHKHIEGVADKPERFNISDEKSQISNLELAAMIAKFIGRKLDYDIVSASTSRPGHDIHYGLSGAKLAALGWKSPLTLETSMRNTVEWYEEHPEWLDPK